MLGRIVLAAGALLLFAAACIHVMGLPMVSGWGEGLGHQQHQAICVMWANASVGWAVVALLWFIAAWRRGPWLGAAAIAALLPAYGGAGVMYIDPAFFGGQMVVGSVVLAAIGLLLLRGGNRPATHNTS